MLSLNSFAASAHLNHIRCWSSSSTSPDESASPPPSHWPAGSQFRRPDQTCGLSMVCSSRMGRDFWRTKFLRHSCRRFSSRTCEGNLLYGWTILDAAAAQVKRSSRRSSALTSSDADLAAEGEGTDEDIGMNILKLSIPALGIVLSDPLMSLIDTGCVGQISSIQLAALGPNTLIFNFVFQVFTFLGTTTCNFMANTNIKVTTPQEQRDLQMKASRTLSQALLLAAILGLAITGLMEAFAPQLLLLMGAGPDYMKPALTYIRIRTLSDSPLKPPADQWAAGLAAVSAPAVFMLLVGQGACLGLQDANTPLFINSVAASVNLVGDLVFTFLAGWGVAGVAWATVASQYIAVFLLFNAMKPKALGDKRNPKDESKSSISGDPVALQIGWFGVPSMEVLGPFYNMAASLMLRYVLGMVVYTSMGKVAAQVGTLSVAAHQVAMQVFWFLSYFPETLAISAQSLVARDVKRNRERAHAVARLLLLLSLGLGLALTSVVAAVHYFGISWLTTDERVVSLVISVTKQSMLCELLCAVAIVIEGVAIASGDLAYLNRMQLLNLGGMLFALISTYRSGWGLPGIWWCFVLFFGIRISYHAFHITSHWHTHILGASPSKATAA